MKNEYINVTTLEEQRAVLDKVMDNFSEEHMVYTYELIVDIKCILSNNIDEAHSNYEDLILDIVDKGVDKLDLYGFTSIDDYNKFFENNFTNILYLYNQLVDPESGKHPISYLDAPSLSYTVFDYVIKSIANKYSEALRELIDKILYKEHGTSNSLVRRSLSEKYRLPKGSNYFYITDRFQVYCYVDDRTEVDDAYFNSGNYFRCYVDALSLAKALENN